MAQLAKISIDSKFVELTADVFRTYQVQFFTYLVSKRLGFSEFSITLVHLRRFGFEFSSFLMRHSLAMRAVYARKFLADKGLLIEDQG